MNFLSKTLYNCDLVSPQEAFAIERKLINSFVPFRSKPSAMLSITEPEEPSIWLLSLKLFFKFVFSIISKTSWQSILDNFQISKSSID